MGNKLNICLTEYIVCYPLFPQAGLVGKVAIRVPSTPSGFPNALEETAEVLGHVRLTDPGFKHMLK